MCIRDRLTVAFFIKEQLLWTAIGLAGALIILSVIKFTLQTIKNKGNDAK